MPNDFGFVEDSDTAVAEPDSNFGFVADDEKQPFGFVPDEVNIRPKGRFIPRIPEPGTRELGNAPLDETGVRVGQPEAPINERVAQELITPEQQALTAKLEKPLVNLPKEVYEAPVLKMFAPRMAEGMAEGTKRAVEGMISPVGLATVPYMAVGGAEAAALKQGAMAARIIAGAFGVQGAAQLPEAGQRYVKAVEAGDQKAAASAWVDLAANSLMAIGGLEAVRGVKKALETPPRLDPTELPVDHGTVLPGATETFQELVPESRRLLAPRTNMPEFSQSTLEPEGPPGRALPAPGESGATAGLLPESPEAPRTAGFRIELPVEPETAKTARQVWSKPIDVDAQVEGVDAIRQLASMTEETRTQGEPYKAPTVNVDLRQLERQMQRNTVSKVESWADEVIDNKLKSTSANPFLDPEFLAAVAAKGAILFKKGVTKAAEWNAAMREQFGRGIEDKLPMIYEQSRDYWEGREAQKKSGAPETPITEGEPNAISQQSTTALHGDVLRGGERGETPRPMSENVGEPTPGLRQDQGERTPSAQTEVSPESSDLSLGITGPAYRKVNEIGALLTKVRDGFEQLWKGKANREEIAATLDGADTLARNEGRQVYNSLRLDLPNRADREAVYAIVEADSDYHKLGVFVNQARGNNQRAFNAARLAMSDYARLLPFADRVKSILDAQIGMEQARGINTEYREGYVPHIIDTDLLMGTRRPVVLAGRSGGLVSGFKKGRVFDTIYDAIEKGYKPRSIDVAEVIEHRVRAGQSLINRKAWADSMRSMTDPVDHKPIVTDLEHRDYGGARPAEDVAPMGYQTREIAGQRVAVHEGYTPIIDALTGNSVIAGNLVGKLLLNTEGLIKHGLLLFDTFHASRIFQKEMGLTRGSTGYRKGLSLLEYSDGDLAKAEAAGEITPEMVAYARANRGTADTLMKAGLNVGQIQEALYAHMVRKIPGISTFNNWVFQKLTRGAMLESGIFEVERYMRDNPGMTEAQAAKIVAPELNKLFGNLGRQGIFKSASGRDIARLVFLAPQWVESMAATEVGSVRQAIGSLAHGKSPIEGTLARSVGQGLLAYIVGTQVLNLATRGYPTWENEEKGHKLDAWIPDVTGKTPGYFLSPLSVVAELTHDAIRYMYSEGTPLKAGWKIVGNKLSPMGRAIDVLRTRKDYKGEPLGSDWEVLQAAGLSLAPTPIPLSPLTRKDNAGQVQRQITASLGIKTENAPTADSQIHELARSWAQSSDDPKIRMAAERQAKESSAPSDYTALKKALRVEDYDAAKEEYQKLLTTHNAKQIYNSLKPNHLVTGKSTTEAQFRDSLTMRQQELYERAREERRKVFQRFLDLDKEQPEQTK